MPTPAAVAATAMVTATAAIACADPVTGAIIPTCPATTAVATLAAQWPHQLPLLQRLHQNPQQLLLLPPPVTLYPVQPLGI
jgi:hypothetical protein